MKTGVKIEEQLVLLKSFVENIPPAEHIQVQIPGNHESVNIIVEQYTGNLSLSNLRAINISQNIAKHFHVSPVISSP